MTCLYRRDTANLPGSAREVRNAEEEGVQFEWLANPLAINDHEDGSQTVRVQRMRLGAPDASGRRSPEPVDGDVFDLGAELVIAALGFEAEDLPKAFANADLARDRWGNVAADRDTRMTSLEGVFVAGDIYRGASLVVWAIKDGLDAAQSIQTYLDNRYAVLGAAE